MENRIRLYRPSGLWYLATFTIDCKNIVVNNDWWYSRQNPTIDIEYPDDIVLDTGGVIALDRPWQTIVIQGIAFKCQRYKASSIRRCLENTEQFGRFKVFYMCNKLQAIILPTEMHREMLEKFKRFEMEDESIHEYLDICETLENLDDTFDKEI